MSMFRQKSIIKVVARCLLLTMTYQVLFPVVSSALTSGPSQPEVQSFEPVGTTDMVDMFTGDFSYNIPLMDVEGYPLNIAYHAGIGMDQEASWVGLGWNINPGVINRSLRGLPDDFKGEHLQKELHIKQETVKRYELMLGSELFGNGDPSMLGADVNASFCMNVNNYRGITTDFNVGGSVRMLGFVSAGANIGVGCETGTNVNYYGALTLATPQLLGKDISANVSITKGASYNTKAGIKQQFTNVSTGAVIKGGYLAGPSVTSSVPIAVNNYVPVITNSSTMRSILTRVKVGAALSGWFPYLSGKVMNSWLNFNNDGSRNSYGYLYLQDATSNDIVDFTRDKDGLFNRNMRYLPPGNMTYDVYSVAGQGTGGSFRPFRNDYGTVFDPITKSTQKSTSDQYEAGYTAILQLGTDLNWTTTNITSGPWSKYSRRFSKPNNSLYQPAYFKQGGEMTAMNPSYWNEVKNGAPIDYRDIMSFPQNKFGSLDGRDIKANLVSYQTANEARYKGALTQQKIYSYTDTNGLVNGPDVSKVEVPRYDISNGYDKRKDHHITEFSQTLPDGRRYVYGLPAMNNVQRESMFSIDAVPDGESTGQVYYDAAMDGMGNNKGTDNYYSSTITPAYAHSYLLTSVFSNDYVDITGDGPTDDDLGTYHKLNYTRTSDDYRWRAPIDPAKAQYNKGYLTDKGDDKAFYIVGSREQWTLHSIESKNYVAEFYTSKREDAKGVSASIKGASGYESSNVDHKQFSYKLDSIRLFNKHERYLNKNAAIPIKTVIFDYSYELCQGVPNGGSGKLTLKKIFMKYGNSNRSMISPYQFDYANENPNYNQLRKDRWGNYAVNTSAGLDFPYVNQSDPNLDNYAGVWSLTGIKLPSGGYINVEYEADDYAYVQNAKAMEMKRIEGVGLSPLYMPGNMLFLNVLPCLYLYFKKSNTINADRYCQTGNVFFNANVTIVGNQGEQIKGYATVKEVGNCPNNSGYGYIKLAPVSSTYHPISFTALNTANYNIPYVLNPAMADQKSFWGNIKTMFKAIRKNIRKALKEKRKKGKERTPVDEYLPPNRFDCARFIILSQSYVRLTTPAGKKKGGGHRVRKLTFGDSWSDMTNNNSEKAVYGKNYSYEMNEGGEVGSSGVASYEPMVGGEENPLRQPTPYFGGGSPNNDAPDLYQESPIGESLYPAPLVGYRKVTVSSIHQDKGRSSQEVDVYRFYTAKDYPVSTSSTSLQSENEIKYGLFKHRNIFRTRQGFTICFNDMHGKPKSVEHFVRRKSPTATNENLQLISSQSYIYNSDYGGRLINEVDVLERSGNNYVKNRKTIGVDVDVTFDSRQKKEHTTSFDLNMNGIVTVLPFPIVVIYPWETDHRNEYYSLVSTKVIQQYGILKAVVSNNEGAITSVTSEVFDPNTGMPIITSVNNEFGEREYTMNYPAYWAYPAMGHASSNEMFETSVGSVNASMNGQKEFSVNGISNTIAFSAGDEVLVVYEDGDSSLAANVITKGGNTVTLQPKDVSAFTNHTSIDDIVRLKIVRSGKKNQLNESIQTLTIMGLPFSNNVLVDTFADVIDIKARTFKQCGLTTFTNSAPAYNPYSVGEKGVYRLDAEYAYTAKRKYTTPATVAGLYNAGSKWKMQSGSLQEASSINWKVVKQAMKWTPYGAEVENMDAVGNFSTSVYGFNEQLPVAVASNSRQGEVFAESFEDYSLLLPSSVLTRFGYSPFKKWFTPKPSGISGYDIFNKDIDTTYIDGIDPIEISRKYKLTNALSHTGKYCLFVESANPGNANMLKVPVGQPNSNKYSPFTLRPNTQYVLSYWTRPKNITGTERTYASVTTRISTGIVTSVKASNIIDEWQQVEVTFNTSSQTTADFSLANNSYYDDIRIFPSSGNMKSFVYHPILQRLMATLDENNYATFYEYDREGNLIRTKKETEAGIMTISESRSANPKTN